MQAQHLSVHTGTSTDDAPLSVLATAVGVRFHPGDNVAARRPLGAAPGPLVHAGSKGMIIEVSPARRCSVRFHSGLVMRGLDAEDIVAIQPDLRC